ncbi:hypothetical protein ABZ490_44270 [Streptomyces sp. NPDC005811]
MHLTIRTVSRPKGATGFVVLPRHLGAAITVMTRRLTQPTGHVLQAVP